jgi:hypothetical protein
MELVKNIFFNTDKLTPFIKVKISYTGKFFENNSNTVFIHYGFGKNWENGSDIQMTKSELGYQAEIDLIKSDTFNICFYNDKNEWDNNNFQDYIFQIEDIDLNLITVENNNLLNSKHNLSSFYLWKKKVKINIYKAITFLPNLIKGKYKRKFIEN